MQQAPQALKQIALTDKQIESVLAAQPRTWMRSPRSCRKMTSRIPRSPRSSTPWPRRYGFASYDEYNDVVDNISMVLGGFDPATKKYVGTEAVIKAQIAEVQADKKMSAKDKKEALADLNAALKAPGQPVIQNKGNIDLVGKYYDKLAAAHR